MGMSNLINLKNLHKIFL